MLSNSSPNTYISSLPKWRLNFPLYKVCACYKSVYLAYPWDTYRIVRKIYGSPNFHFLLPYKIYEISSYVTECRL